MIMFRITLRRLCCLFIPVVFLIAAGCGKVDDTGAESETAPGVGSTNDTPTISTVSNRSVDEDNSTGTISFTVSDSETFPDDLVLTAGSSDTSVVAASGIVLGGSGSNRTVKVTPVANAFGSSVITLTVTDEGNLSASETFTLTVNPVNDAPTIASIADASMDEDTSKLFSFDVGDVETTDLSNLDITADSSNPSILPQSELTLGGSGANRTLMADPLADQNTDSTDDVVITITVSDGSLNTTGSFVLAISGVNDAPTISSIPDGFTNKTVYIPFSVNDIDGPSLSVDVTTDQPAKFPSNNIDVSDDSTGNFTHLVIYPAADQAGSANFLVTVSDGQLEAQEVFSLTITSCKSNMDGSILASGTFLDEGFICGDASNDVLIRSGNTVTWDGTGGPLIGNIEVDAGGTFQITGSGGEIQGDVYLDGGTLDIDADITIAGNLNLSSDSTIDIDSANRLVYSGDALNIDSRTLFLAGEGEFSNSPNYINLNNTSGSVRISGNSELTGPVRLAGGTLDIDADVNISGRLSQADDATIDIETGRTLTYSNVNALDIGANTLTLSGDGILNNQSEFSISQGASVLAVRGDLEIQGDLEFGNGKLELYNNLLHTGSVSVNSTPTIYIASGYAYTNSLSSFNLTDDTLTLTGRGTLAAGLVLENTTLNVEESGTISGDVSLSSSSTLNISSGKTLSYSGSSIGIGANTLTFSGPGTLDLSNDLELDNAGSVLALNGSGGTISDILVSANITGGSGIDVSSDFTVNRFSQTSAGSRFTIDSGVTLVVTDPLSLATGRTVEISGEGSFETDALLTLSGNLTQAGNATLDIDGGLTLNSGSVLTLGSGTLDLTGSTLILAENLNVSGGTLITNSTNLTLSADATVRSDQEILITALDVDVYTLTLGDASTDLSIVDTSPLSWNNANSGIITGDADLTLNPSLTIANGRITSTGGEITLNNTCTVTSGTFDISGSRLVLSGTLNTMGSTLTTDASTDLYLTGTSVVTSGSAIGLRDLDLNGNQLVLGSSTSNLTVNGSIVDGIGSAESIQTGLAGFSYSSGLAITGGSLTSTGGTLSLGDITNDGGTFSGSAGSFSIGSFTAVNNGTISLNGISLTLNGDLNVSDGDISTDTNTDITLGADSTITTVHAVNTGNLDLGGYTLTLGTGTPSLTVNTSVSGLNAATAGIVSDGSNLTLVPAFTASSGSRVSSSGGTVTLGDATFDGGSSLDISGTDLVLGGNLNTGSGSLTTDSSTDLTLNADAAVTSNDPLTIDELDLSTYLLTLGDASTDATVDTITGGIADASAGIDTGTADLTVISTVNMTAGTLSSSGGTLTFKGDVSGGSSSLTTTGGTVVLSDDVTLSSNALDTTGSTWQLGGNTLSLDSSNAFAGDIVLSGGTLDVNTSLTVSGEITTSGSSNINIAPGNTLTCSGTAIPLTTGSLLFNEAGTFAGALNLGGGSLDIQESMEVTGDITLSGNSSITLLSNKTFTYSGVDISIDAYTLTLDGGQDSAFNNSGTLLLNNTAGSLVLESNTGGVDASVDLASVSLNGGLIDVDAGYTLASVASGTTDSSIDVASGGTLVLTGGYTVAAGQSLEVLGGGTLQANGLLTVNDTLTQTGSVTMDINAGLTLGSGGTFTLGSGILDLTGAGLTLASSLNTSGGTLTTSGTTLDISADVTLESDQTITITDLTLNNNLLTLGDANSDLSVTNSIDTPWNASGEGINSQDADLSITPVFSATAGQLLSSGGTLTFGNTADISADSLDITATTLELYGNLTISVTDLTTDTQTHINLNSAVTIAGNPGLSIGNLELNGNILTLDDSLPSFVVNGTIDQIGSSEGIVTGNAGFTYSSGLSILDNGFFSSTGGTITLSDVTVDTGSFASIGGTLNLGNVSATGGGDFFITGTALNLGGNIDTSSGDISTDASTDLTLQTNAGISTAQGLTIGNLDISGYALTLVTGTPSLTVAATLTGLDNPTERIITNNANLTITPSFTATNSAQITSSSGTVTFQNDVTFDGSSTLDIIGTELALFGNLNTTGGTLTTDGNSSLTLGDHVTLTSNDPLDLNRITPGSYLLNLGSATTDITADTIFGDITVSGSGIDTGTADLYITNSLTVSDGSLISSGGNLTFFGSVTGSSTLSTSGGTLVTLLGNLTLDPASLSTADSTWDTSGDVLSIGGDPFAGNILLSGGRLDTSEDVTISGNITYSGNSNLNIAPGTTLSYSGTSIPVDNNILKFNETGTFAGALNLGGGTLDIRDSMEVTGDITLSGNSSITLLSNKSFTYSGSDISIDAYTLTLDGEQGSSFNNSGTLLLNNTAGSLVLESSTGGVDASVDLASVSLNGGLIDADAGYILASVASGTTDSSIDVASGGTLVLTGGYTVPAGQTLEVLGGGTLQANGLLTVNDTLTQTGSVTMDVNSGLTLGSGATFTLGSGTLDLTGTGLTLASSLNTSGGTLTTGGTTLDISTDVTLESDQAVTITDLTLNDNLLTLGDASSDLSVTNSIDAPWNATGEGIDKHDASLDIAPAFSMTAGRLLSSGGSLIFRNTAEADISADDLDISGTTVELYGDLTLSVTDLTVDVQTDFNLNNSVTITSNQGLSFGDLTLNGNTLTLDNSLPSFIVNGTLVNGIGSSEGIVTQDAGFTYSSGLSIADNGSFSSTGGTITLSDVTVDTGSFSSTAGTLNLGNLSATGGGDFFITGTALNLGGNIDTSDGDISTDASTDLTLQTNAGISSAQGLTIGNLDISGYALTLVTGTPSLTVAATLMGLDASTDQIITNDASLDIQPAFTATNSAQITSSGGTLTFRSDATFDGASTLNINSTELVLYGNLNTTGGTLTTDGNSSLTLGDHVILTSGDPLNLSRISPGSYLLTLGSATTDITADTVDSITVGGAGIDSGIADLYITNSLTVSDGSLISSGGDLTFSGGVSGSSTLSTSGGTRVTLLGNLTLDPASLSTADSTWDISSYTLTMQTMGSNPFAGNIVLGGGTLDTDENVSISGDITYSGASNIAIASGRTLGYSGTAIAVSSGELAFNETGSFGGNLNLNGGTLHVQASMDVTGDISLSADSTIDVDSSQTFTYSGSDVSVDTYTLTLNCGNNSTFDNSGSLVLNNSAGTLSLKSDAGTSGAVTLANITLNGGLLDADAGYSITTVTEGTADASIDILTGATFAFTNGYSNPSGQTLELLGGGTLVTSGLLTINEMLNQTGSATLDINSGLTLATDATLDIGSGTLDLSGAVTLGSDLNTSSGTINSSNVTLDVSGDITLTTGQRVNVLTLNLNDNLLTLGDASSDLRVTSSIPGWDGANEGIDSQGADLDIQPAITVSGGYLLSSGGTMTFSGASNINGAGFDVTGTELILKNNLSINVTDLTTDTATTDLTLTRDATLTSNFPFSINDLDLGGKVLTLGSADTDLTVNGSVIGGIVTNEGIVTGDADFSYASGLTISGGTLSSTGGTLTLADVTADSGTFDISGSLLTLGGNLNTTGAQFTTDVTTDLTLTTDSTITTGNTFTVRNLDISGDTLTLGSSTSDLTVETSITGLTLGSEFIATGSADLEIKPSLTVSNAQITSSSGTITLSDATFDTGAALDIRGSELVLNGSLNTTGADLSTDVSSSLTLNAHATLTSDNPLNLNQLTTGGFLLTLGSATTDITADTVADISVSGSGIDTGPADLYVNNSLTMSDGSLISSGGNLTFFGTIDGNSSVSTSGSTYVTLGGELTLDPATLNTGDSTWDVPSSRVLNLGGNPFAGSILLNSGTLETSEDVTISGNITYTGSSSINIDGTSTLTYDGTTDIPITANSLMFNDTGTFAGNLNLDGGSLSINASMEITGDIGFSSDSTIDVLSPETFTYSGADISVGTNTLRLSGGQGSTFSNTGNILLDNTSGSLVLSSISGADASVDITNVSLNGGLIDADASYTISTVTQGTTDSSVDIASGAILIFSNGYTVPAGQTLGVFGAGRLRTDGLLTINDTLLQSGSVRLDIDAGLEIGSAGTLTLGSGTLDLTGSNLRLANHLNTSGGTLITGSTTLDVSGDVTLQSNDSITVTDLTLNTFLLTLGDASSDLTVTNSIESPWTAGMGINTQDADLNLDASLDINNGSLLSSGGTISLDATFDVLAGSFDVTGTSVALGADVSLSPTDMTTDSSTWNLGSNSLTWNGSGGTFKGTLSMPTGSVLNVTTTSPAQIDAALALSGGTLDIDTTADLNTGTITIAGDSTIDVQSGRTLTYNAAAINLGGYNLAFAGSGIFSNTGAVTLNSASSTLSLQAAGTVAAVSISGADLTTGGIDVSADATITALSLANSATITVDTGNTLFITSNLTIPSNKTLTIEGGGSIHPDGSITVNSAGSLAGNTSNLDFTDTDSITLNGLTGTLTGGTGTLTFGSGVTAFGGGILDVRDTTVVQQGTLDLNTNTLTTDSSTDWSIPASATLNWNGSGSTLQGQYTVSGSGSTFRFHTNSNDISAAFILNGGTLDVDVTSDFNIDSSITLSGDATFDVVADSVLDYSGEEIDVSADTLTLVGPGTIDNYNYNYLNLENPDSVLQMTGGGSIKWVKVTEDINSGSGMIMTGDYFINDLQLEENLSFTGSGNTLEITNNLTVDGSPDTVILEIISQTLKVDDIVLYSSFTIDGTITLSPDSKLWVYKDATFDAGSDLTFKDGLRVEDGATLRLVSSGNYTLTIEGSLEIIGSGRVIVGSGVTLNIQISDLDDETYSKISGDGGVIVPGRITDFQATAAGSQTIDLTWGNDASTDVLICRSTVGYYSVPCDLSGPDKVYDSAGESVTDSDLTNDVTYYYTAFSHDASYDIAGILKANATPYDPASDYFDYNVQNFSAAPLDSAVSLNWSDASGDYAGVVIRRKTGGYPDSTGDGEPVCDTTADSYTDKGLQNGTIYYYRAYAYDSSGDYSTGVNTSAAPAIIPSGLVSYYPLNSSEQDGSGQGNHGTLTNLNSVPMNTANMQHVTSSAYRFDGDDYIEIDNPVSDDFSISFWIQTSQSSGQANTDWYDNIGIVEGYDGALQNDFGLSLGQNGEILFGVARQDESTTVTLTGPRINTGDWKNVSATRSKNSRSIKLYVDGAQVASSSATDNQSLNSPDILQIARQEGAVTFLDASMDEIRFYNRTLTPVEIQRLYFSGISRIEGYLRSSVNHSCALLDGETIKCWGTAGTMGRLGDGTTGSSPTLTPVAVSNIENATQISTGTNHSCAVLTDGTINCWGEGSYGKLGNNSTAEQATPVEVLNITTALQVSAGAEHTCAVLDNDFNSTIQCWGNGENGRLGNSQAGGTFLYPDGSNTLVSGISTAVQVGTGENFSCALLQDKTVVCWGNTLNGRLGNGDITDTDILTPVPTGITDAIQLSVGDEHACVLTDSRRVKCWGDGTNARMGDGSSATASATPVTVSGISNAIQVSAGRSHTCAVLADNTAKCWGDGQNGQLGDEGGSTQVSPVVVSINSNEIDDAMHISAGEQFTCVTTAAGAVKCWGSGSEGQLSDSTSDAVFTPVTVDLGSGKTARR